MVQEGAQAAAGEEEEDAHSQTTFPSQWVFFFLLDERKRCETFAGKNGCCIGCTKKTRFVPLKIIFTLYWTFFFQGEEFLQPSIEQTERQAEEKFTRVEVKALKKNPLKAKL